jgi:plasmid stabilization system protein ParE
MAEIEWTETSKFRLQQIYDYIARDNEEAAWQVILGIYDRVQVLLASFCRETHETLAGQGFHASSRGGFYRSFPIDGQSNCRKGEPEAFRRHIDVADFQTAENRNS